jgi:hypothetical protein
LLYVSRTKKQQGTLGLGMTWNDLDTYGTIASEMERMAKSKQTHTQKKTNSFLPCFANTFFECRLIEFSV